MLTSKAKVVVNVPSLISQLMRAWVISLAINIIILYITVHYIPDKTWSAILLLGISLATMVLALWKEERPKALSFWEFMMSLTALSGLINSVFVIIETGSWWYFIFTVGFAFFAGFDILLNLASKYTGLVPPNYRFIHLFTFIFIICLNIFIR